MPYGALADLVLLLHALFVAFVVLGLVLVLFGALRGWHWVRNPWFRLAHLLAIACVTLQAWSGRICPLTNLEALLRSHAGETPYRGGFVAHWTERLLYYDAPLWLFAVAYTAFGLLVLVSWIVVRPRPPGCRAK